MMTVSKTERKLANPSSSAIHVTQFLVDMTFCSGGAAADDSPGWGAKVTGEVFVLVERLVNQ